MNCDRCGESHTGGFMLVMEPAVCVYCYYGIAVSSDQYGRKTRAQDRAEAEAHDEMFDHFDASGHNAMRSRWVRNKFKLKCEGCEFAVERKPNARQAGSKILKGEKKFCPCCDKTSLVKAVRRKKTMNVRSTKVLVEVVLSRCSSCKKTFATQAQEEENVRKAYDLYKAKTGRSAYRRDRA